MLFKYDDYPAFGINLAAQTYNASALTWDGLTILDNADERVNITYE